jgi:hypothetical protein
LSGQAARWEGKVGDVTGREVEAVREWDTESVIEGQLSSPMRVQLPFRLSGSSIVEQPKQLIRGQGRAQESHVILGKERSNHLRVGRPHARDRSKLFVKFMTAARGVDDDNFARLIG